MRHGRVMMSKDLPTRTEQLLGALKRHGVSPEPPAALGVAAARAVHTDAYLTFLETIWSRWETVPERGLEVWPNTFPYWSGRVEDDARPPCPAEGVIGQIGWYIGDLAAPIGPHSWTSILKSCETAVTAADAVLAGDRSAYALCRPSGHHARTDRGSGLCYINNTAAAAQRLRQRYSKVAILDIDAHHGDGTQQIFYKRDDVLAISIHADPSTYYPFFTGYAGETGYGAGEGYNLNLPLAHGAGADAMTRAIDQAMAKIRGFGADALVVALGFDAHEKDPIGVLKLTSRDFETVGRQMSAAGLPTLIVQEGGYAIDAIGDCLDAFLSGLGVTSP